MKLVMLFLQYDQNKYPGTFFHVLNYLKIVQGVEFEFVVIDNKQTDVPPHILNTMGRVRTHYISGDNSEWEFSGWQKGVEYLDQHDIQYDALLFCNDSCLMPPGRGLWQILNINTISQACTNDVMIGLYPVCTRFYNELNGVDVSGWIRSHCFLVSKKIINGLRTVVSFKKPFLNRCIAEQVSFPYFKPTAPMNASLKRFVVLCLEKYWHQRFQIDTNWELFRMKTLAFFNEYMLTARVRMMGFKTVNIEEDWH